MGSFHLCVHPNWRDGLKWVQMGSIYSFEHPKWSRIILGKTRFDQFLTHFGSPNGPFFFWTLERAKWLKMGSKWAHFTCLCTLKTSTSFLKNTFLTRF